MDYIFVEAFLFLIIPLIIASRGKEISPPICAFISFVNYFVVCMLWSFCLYYGYGLFYTPSVFTYVVSIANYKLLRNGPKFFKNDPVSKPAPVPPRPEPPALPSPVPSRVSESVAPCNPSRHKTGSRKVRRLKRKITVYRVIVSLLAVFVVVLSVVFYRSYSSVSSERDYYKAQYVQYKEQYSQLENTYKKPYQLLRSAYLRLYEASSNVKAACDIAEQALRGYDLYFLDNIFDKLPELQRCLNTLYRTPVW